MINSMSDGTIYNKLKINDNVIQYVFWNYVQKIYICSKLTAKSRLNPQSDSKEPRACLDIMVNSTQGLCFFFNSLLLSPP